MVPWWTQRQRSKVHLARRRECRNGQRLADTPFLQYSGCGPSCSTEPRTCNRNFCNCGNSAKVDSDLGQQWSDGTRGVHVDPIGRQLEARTEKLYPGQHQWTFTDVSPVWTRRSVALPGNGRVPLLICMGGFVKGGGWMRHCL